MPALPRDAGRAGCAGRGRWPAAGWPAAVSCLASISACLLAPGCIRSFSSARPHSSRMAIIRFFSKDSSGVLPVRWRCPPPPVRCAGAPHGQIQAFGAGQGIGGGAGVLVVLKDPLRHRPARISVKSSGQVRPWVTGKSVGSAHPPSSPAGRRPRSRSSSLISWWAVTGPGLPPAALGLLELLAGLQQDLRCGRPFQALGLACRFIRHGQGSC